MEIPEDLKKKFEEIKSRLEKYNQFLIKEIGEKLISVSVLPPAKLIDDEEKRLSKEEIEKIKNKVNVLVIVNLDDEKDPLLVKDQIIKKITAKAQEIDKEISPFVLELYDIREDCFDVKYDTLVSIASSAVLYDPKEFIAAIKISELHKSMVLKKFEKYIVSYVAAGSLFRGDKVSHDIDVYVVVDDTDVKKMTRVELRDKLLAIMRRMGDDAARETGVQKMFHIQTYILTDFWESVKDAHPVIFTFLRDGVPIYDRGVFMPWKLLLKMGRIRPSPESIDLLMSTGDRLVQRTKGKMISVVSEDLYYALLNTAQAALMLYGMAPPTPRETIKLLDEIFVKKEKLLEKKYVDQLQKVFDYYKQIEHGKITEVSGKDIDDFLANADDFLNRVKKLFNQIQKKRDRESIDELCKTCTSLLDEILDLEHVKLSGTPNHPNMFKKHLVDKKLFPLKDLETFNLVLKTKKNFSTEKLNPTELEKVRREGRVLIKDMLEYLQRRRGYEFDRAKIRFKYGEKFGEAILLENLAFVIEDIASESKRVIKAELKNGVLGKFTDSTFEELELALKDIKIPPKVFIKEHIFEGLRKQFGSDIEILLNY